jgi:hypothetical protein
MINVLWSQTFPLRPIRAPLRIDTIGTGSIHQPQDIWHLHSPFPRAIRYSINFYLTEQIISRRSVSAASLPSHTGRIPNSKSSPEFMLIIPRNFERVFLMVCERYHDSSLCSCVIIWETLSQPTVSSRGLFCSGTVGLIAMNLDGSWSELGLRKFTRK